MAEQHKLEIKVYYEDTDSLGVVYYANYLKYFERGRTEVLEAGGKPVQQWNAEGYLFAVYKLEVTYLKPALLGDICQVVTTPLSGSDFRKQLRQQLVRDGEVLTEARVDLVCLDRHLELQEFPPGSIN